MPAQQLPPLCQGATDFDSDSDYLGTPVDAPAISHPQVVEYAPQGAYYYGGEAYASVEYATGHNGSLVEHSPDPTCVAAAAPHSLLLNNPYPVMTSASHNQYDSGCSAVTYPILPSQHIPTKIEGEEGSLLVPKVEYDSSDDLSSSLLLHSRRADVTRAHSDELYLPYNQSGADEWRGSRKSAGVPLTLKTEHQLPDLARDTEAATMLSSSAPSSYASSKSSLPNGNAALMYFEDCYSDSPIDDNVYHDHRLAANGHSYEYKVAYDVYPSPSQTHRDGHPAPTRPRFYQPPSCPYSYPHFDSPKETSGYAPHMVPSSNAYGHSSVIHAPRPKQPTDMHTLHNKTYPYSSDDASVLLSASHRVLSIPSIPAPPIPRPSSLIEDSPKKPLTLACFFCRKRKIACQSPPAGSLDRTCNQCTKRKLKCEYPATSRRGVRPRVYDLADDTFRRPSLPYSL